MFSWNHFVRDGREGGKLDESDQFRVVEGLVIRLKGLVLFFFLSGQWRHIEGFAPGVVCSESCPRKMNLLGCARREFRLEVNLEG